MKCRDTIGQIVMPIFYDVDPSEVRKQKRKYGEAFAKHELENKTKVESWRKSLEDASNISGWELKQIANGDESKGIKHIIFKISQKLQPLTSSASENLIGMEARLESLRLELQVGSGGVRMVGIWGVGGGGKTTLASTIYDEISRKFDGCCLVENIREESGRHGLGKLKEKILSEMEVNKVGGGGHLINNRFRHRKVLIVLDDVDHLDQLKALAGSHDWFGDGSRIIITTRDKHLLTAHKVNVIHNISLLNDDEALKLFCKHALPDDRPFKDYEKLSIGVVSYAGGLPLALTVLGSFLCDKDIDEWMSALARLKEIPNDDIVEKLKISFSGLTKVEKELFLDIAYFFRRQRKDEAMKILGACNYHPVIGEKVLIQKALITISKYGEFDMHDLVQEMAYHIVRAEHPNRPETHSRVRWEDIEEICAMDATTNVDMIEAICGGGNEYLPLIVANSKNLRWIDWVGDLSGPLLTNFPPRTLCCLTLEHSPQIQLWEGYKILPNLKIIRLYELENLITTPNFEGLPNLEEFNLFNCGSLKEISIVHLKKLVLLHIEDCECLEIMIPRILELEKLKTLSFDSCTVRFNKNIDDSDNVGGEVASYIESSPKFSVGCSNVPGVEHYLEDHSSPHNQQQSSCMGLFLKNLTDLNLGNCCLGDEIGSAVWNLPNLIKLNLRGNDFSRLNFSCLRLPRLKCLDVSCCSELVKLSELPSSIAVVCADWCESLESFGDISNCKWLCLVSLRGKNKLGPAVGDILLDSMLQGNASEDYFINITLKPHIPKSFVGRLFREKTITLDLLDDWYNGFWGFSICFVPHRWNSYVDIVIKQEVDKDSLFGDWQKSNEAVEPEYGATKTCVGYISFGSLRHTAFSNSSDTMISVSLRGEGYIGARLIPRKSEGDQPRTTKVAADSSEFWDEELGDRPQPFKIIHDSKSSINITWKPWDNWL
ncbi:hypothetical protein L1887_15402 [Cichorium endivia]|nr:hypothetical protein L1887_15402 [Cichorium endivia]